MNRRSAPGKGIDIFQVFGYTNTQNKGAARQRLAPRIQLQEVTATVGTWGRLLLFMVVDRQEQSTQADDNQI
ncbi:MAG: hypothetical protein LUC47_04460 [Clostridiales bacterium]|nr:hypothetical protein [Clostridiales bacterium]